MELSSLRFSADSLIMYAGLSIDWKYNLEMYSPINPIVKSCAPEKIAMIDAKKVNPSTEELNRINSITT